MNIDYPYLVKVLFLTAKECSDIDSKGVLGW